MTSGTCTSVNDYCKRQAVAFAGVKLQNFYKIFLFALEHFVKIRVKFQKKLERIRYDIMRFVDALYICVPHKCYWSASPCIWISYWKICDKNYSKIIFETTLERSYGRVGVEKCCALVKILMNIIIYATVNVCMNIWIYLSMCEYTHVYMYVCM